MMMPSGDPVSEDEGFGTGGAAMPGGEKTAVMDGTVPADSVREMELGEIATDSAEREAEVSKSLSLLSAIPEAFEARARVVEIDLDHTPGGPGGNRVIVKLSKLMPYLSDAEKAEVAEYLARKSYKTVAEHGEFEADLLELKMEDVKGQTKFFGRGEIRDIRLRAIISGAPDDKSDPTTKILWGIDSPLRAFGGEKLLFSPEGELITANVDELSIIRFDLDESGEITLAQYCEIFGFPPSSIKFFEKYNDDIKIAILDENGKLVDCGELQFSLPNMGKLRVHASNPHIFHPDGIVLWMDSYERLGELFAKAARAKYESIPDAVSSEVKGRIDRI